MSRTLAHVNLGLPGVLVVVGVVDAVTLALSRPFSGQVRVSPEPFEPVVRDFR